MNRHENLNEIRLNALFPRGNMSEECKIPLSRAEWVTNTNLITKHNSRTGFRSFFDLHFIFQKLEFIISLFVVWTYGYAGTYCSQLLVCNLRDPCYSSRWIGLWTISFSQKPPVIWSILHSGSIRLDFCSHQSASLVNIHICARGLNHESFTWKMCQTFWTLVAVTEGSIRKMFAE